MTRGKLRDRLQTVGQRLRKQQGRQLATSSARPADRAADPVTDPAAAPVVTVVVPVYNTEAYLRECLESLVAQTLTDLEILCVDDGSTDGSAGILADFARRDPRVRVLTQPNAGQGAARNRALAAVKGRYLTFCDSDDTVPPQAYARMVDVLEATGSDFAVGGAQRFRGGVLETVAFPEVHTRDRFGTNLAEFPEAVRDIIACNRMIRTDFWQERVGTFPEGKAYEDHLPMLLCTALADSFDVLSAVTYNWRNREDRTSTSQQKHQLRNLTDRIHAVDEAQQALWASCPEAIQQIWLGRVLDLDLPLFLPFALASGPDYRSALADSLRRMLELADDRALAGVRHARRVQVWLAAQERWDDVSAALLHHRQLRVPPVARVSGDRLVAAETGDFAAGLPDELRGLSRVETALRAGVAWVGTDGADLLVRGSAVVPGLEATGGASTPEVLVRLRAGERVLEAATRPHHDPELDLWEGHPRISCTGAGFVASLPVDQLGGSVWQVEVEVRQGGFARSGVVDRPQPHSAAAAWPQASRTIGRHRVRLDPADGLVVEPANEPQDTDQPSEIPVATSVALTEDGLRITLADPGTTDWQAARLTNQGRHVPVTSVREVAGATELLFVPRLAQFGEEALPLPTGMWELHPSCGVDDGLTRDLPFSQLAGDSRVVVGQRAERGTLRLQFTRPLLDEERGPVGDHRARAELSGGPTELDAVLFWSSPGRTPAESWWPLHEAAHRARPEVTCYWGVHDLAAPLPTGAVPVLTGSRQWYELLRACRWVVSDAPTPDWVVRAPHQRWFHLDLDHRDAPTALTAMAANGMPPLRLDHSAAVEVSAWNALVTTGPADLAIALAAHRWQGAALTPGDPRSDDLVVPERAAVARRQVRAALGIPEATKVLLYLPQRRARSRAGDELGLAKLARRLGPDWMVLRHGPTWRSLAASPQLLEVSHHPRLSHLLLAADAAVLERTEARFLWPLTGRPGVVHLPGGDDSSDPMAPLRFCDTLPGPLVRNLEETVAALDDLTALAATCAGPASTIRETWHPYADGSAAERFVAQLFD